MSDNEGKVAALMSETRRKIIATIVKKPKHITQIAEELDLDRSTINYHLNLLEKVGLVTQQYELIKERRSPGRIGSFFSINSEKLEQAIELAIRALSIT